MEHKQTFKVHDVVCTYFYITTDARALKVLDILDRDDPHTRYGLDIETDHLPEWKNHTPKRGRKAGFCPHLSRIRLVQIYDCKDTVYILDAFHVSKDVIIKILSSKKWVAHNALFEQAHIRKLGAECEQLDIHCSMVQALLVDRAERSPYEPDEDEDDEDDEEVAEKAVKTQGFGLHALSMKYLNLPLKKEYQVSNWGKEELSREQLAYAAMDAIVTKKLYVELYPKLSIEHHMETIYKLSCKMIPVLAEMEGTGLLLDDKAHTALINEWTAELTEIQKRTDQFFPGVNLGSTKQLATWVKKNLPNHVEDWPLTKKGALAFGRPAISHYKTIPAIKALLEYKKVKKKLDAFGEGMKDFIHPVSKRLHCEYTLAETRTGRLSARSPNLQQQPNEEKFRSLFIAPPGCSMICYDLNQIEIRVAAELSDDKVMKSAFTEGVDLHKLIVSRMTNKDVNDISDKERKLGKILNFGLQFGLGAKKLVKHLAFHMDYVMQEDESYHAIQTYKNLYSGYTAWCEKQRMSAEKLGYVTTPLGKKRKLLKDECYTKSVNCPVQGGAAEVLMCALVLMFMAIRKAGLQGRVRLAATVHDEVILYCQKGLEQQVEQIVSDCMSKGMLVVFRNAILKGIAKGGHGQSWSEAK
jgi:DNA polymerase-1